MKRLSLLLALLIAALGLPALAEGGCWYDADRPALTWHATPDCAAGGALTAISEGDANRLGLLPCPVCVQDMAGAKGVAAVERGGTIILRLTDAWMASREDIGSVFAGYPCDVYDGDAGLKALSERLHGDAYVRFLADIAATGRAEASAYYPGIYPENGEAILCQRHVGCAWFTALRPAVAVDDPYPMYLRFFGGPLTWRDGALHTDDWQEWGDDGYRLKLDKRGSKRAFSRDYGGLELLLFRELDADILVVHERHADADLLEDVGLALDGADTGLRLTGYMDGGDAVFVGVLTAPEAARVKAGAVPSLTRKPWLTEEAYQGSDYAIVKKGTAGMGVVDRSGRFVIDPPGVEYAQDITRQGDTFFIWNRDEPRSLRVVRLEGKAPVELLRREAPEDGFISIPVSNSAVFAYDVSDRDRCVWYIHDLDTGAELAALAVNEHDPDAPAYSFSVGIDAKFEIETAKPTRLIFGDLNAEDAPRGSRFFLTDNAGRRVTDDFQYLEALAFSDAGGLYLASRWEPEELTGFPNDEEDLSAGYDGRPWFGAHWRCGVVDENGNALTDMDGVKVTLLSDREVLLERESGEVVTVRR